MIYKICFFFVIHDDTKEDVHMIISKLTNSIFKNIFYGYCYNNMKCACRMNMGQLVPSITKYQN